MEGIIHTSLVSDYKEIREEFPILDRMVNGKKLVYFDNAATTQKPERVISALNGYYRGYNANIHRGIHKLAEEATSDYERTRDSVRNFLNVEFREEIIFTAGTTNSINLVAATWGKKFLDEGDEVIVSTMEHHSNIVPWQLICEEKGAKLRVIPINDEGELDMEAFKSMLSEKTKMVSIVHVSNSLGTVNLVEEIIKLAHGVGAKVLVDGAQSSVHLKIDVQAMDCDFFAMSAHKVYGPTGVGVLYGKKEILEAMPPYMGGGEMIKDVTFEKTIFNELPYKYEAGTPNIADVIAFRSAIEFVESLDRDFIVDHENELLTYGTEKLREMGGIRLVGTAQHKTSVLSFLVEGTHPQDVGILLDQQGIAVRTGHHCTQPLMERLGIPGTVRASFAVYNTTEEIDRLVEALQKVKRMLL